MSTFHAGFHKVSRIYHVRSPHKSLTPLSAKTRITRHDPVVSTRGFHRCTIDEVIVASHDMEDRGIDERQHVFIETRVRPCSICMFDQHRRLSVMKGSHLPKNFLRWDMSLAWNSAIPSYGAGAMPSVSMGAICSMWIWSWWNCNGESTKLVERGTMELIVNSRQSP
jgi:hypothetical protein